MDISCDVEKMDIKDIAAIVAKAIICLFSLDTISFPLDSREGMCLKVVCGSNPNVFEMVWSLRVLWIQSAWIS